MDDFWNSNTLIPPTINSFKCKSAIDIKNVISILDNAIDTFMIPNTLRVESSVMRRVIYRLKLQFRLDKGFKLFENTNRNLNQLFSFNITKDFMYLLDEVPKKYDKDFYFPSKQMLEYVLVRLQGYSQVCSRVVESAFHTAILMKGRVRLGHQWEIAAVCIAICSRIWQICRHFTTKCCLLYSELLPLLDKLEIIGSNWLPHNYQFPNDLVQWLNYDWLLDKPDVILQLPLELPIFSLLDDDENDVQYFGRIVANKSNKGKTIIIPDSDDEDEYTGNVKFVCSFNKSYVHLNKSQVDKLRERKLPAFKRTSESATSLDYDFLGEPIKNPLLHIIDTDEDDEDVQIIELNRTKNHEHSLEVINIENNSLMETDDVIVIDDFLEEEEDTGETISREKFRKSNLQTLGVENTDENGMSDEETKSIKKEKSMDEDQSENVNEFPGVEESQEVVKKPISNKKKRIKKKLSSSKQEDLSSKNEKSIDLDEPEKKLDPPEEEGEEATGETISRENFMENNLFSNEETISREKEKPMDEDVSENVNGFPDVEESQEVVKKPIKKKKKWYKWKKASSKQDLSPEEQKNIIPKSATLKRHNYQTNTAESLVSFLKRENKLRNEDSKKNTTKWNTCISSHLTDENWHCLAFEIKYYIAVSIHHSHEKDPVKRGKYLCIAHEVLKKNLDVTINTINWGYTPEYIFKEPVPLTFKGKEYFIRTLITLPDLQIFLRFESELRTKARFNCFFPNLDDDAWNKVCFEIKYLILLATYRPIKRIVYIKKAQRLLKIKLVDNNEEENDLVLSPEDDDENLRTKVGDKFDNVYKSIPIGTDNNSLFDFVKEIEDYMPPHKRYKIQPKKRLTKKEKKALLKLDADNNDKNSEIEIMKNKKRKLHLEKIERQNKRRKFSHCNQNNYFYDLYYKDLYNYFVR